ncbi:DUF6786 family protein [Acidicapsa ligni]|uniref:DUF6786 family protein n=1 Tax=Acidicapsa ligni TaxID=542300 RepID=UPI0021DFEFC5|nr:DUF6786 family protein [Acidicapsa ligni]
MKFSAPRITIALVAIFMLTTSAIGHAQSAQAKTFKSAVDLVNQHSSLVVLADSSSGASIAVWPAMQGRVLTSSADGPNGHNFGWIKEDLVVSGKLDPHMNTIGGEDRIWLGPEGGQFSIFFAQGTPFDLAHWYTPPAFDSQSFDVVGKTSKSVSFRKTLELTNYSGTKFHVQIDRTIDLLTSAQVWEHVHLAPVAGVKVVGFQSNNKLTNLAPQAFSKSTGLLSLWVLGQFRSSPHAEIILPIRSGPVDKLGTPVTTDYFGAVPADRIHIGDNAVFLKADANYRSKMGLSQARSKGVLGSYDPDNHVLTVVQFSQPSTPADYVNAAWKIQEHPFKGDAANCYNDGPPAPGKPQFGQLYELESSSPAVALASHGTSHDSVEHVQRTMHFVGTAQQLDAIAKAALGVSLKDIPISKD